MSTEQPRDEKGQFAETGSDAHAAGVAASTRQGKALLDEAKAHDASAAAHDQAAATHAAAGNSKRADKHRGHADDAREAAKRVREVFERLRDRIKETGEKGTEAADAITEADPLTAGKLAMRSALARASRGKSKKQKPEDKDVVEDHARFARRMSDQ